MGIKQDFQHYKTLFHQAMDLLLLRLQLLQLDISQQTQGLIRLLAILLLCMVLLLIALMSLLLGFNAVLPEAVKKWAFFALTALLLAVVVGLWRTALRRWQQQGQQVGQTLADMRQDVAYLRGQGSRGTHHES